MKLCRYFVVDRKDGRQYHLPATIIGHDEHGNEIELDFAFMFDLHRIPIPPEERSPQE